MSGKHKSGHCTICRNFFNLLHWHHTVPQALGGKDSLQIPLCSQCHNVLHAHAEAVVAARRNGKPITRTYWSNQEQEQNAEPYLQILVDSISSAPQISDQDKLWMISSRIPDALHRALHLYKIDSGLKNLDSALLLCLTETLKNKGYLNGHDTTLPPTSKTGAKGSKANLW